MKKIKTRRSLHSAPTEDMTLGDVFEVRVIVVTRQYMVCDGDVVRADIATDKNEGTDVFIYGIPCDITYHMNGKDHMDRVGNSIEIFPGVRVCFGVRYGNSYKGFHRFETPVLVIGFEESRRGIIGRNLNFVLARYRLHLQEILDEGMGAYWDWMDLQEA